MRIISHRGNIYGSDPTTENKPSQILGCIINGYDVEIDLWMLGDELFLGHDEPTYPATLDWLRLYNEYLWVHCKNIQALNLVKNEFNAFGHDNDDYVLTSKQFIWVYPDKPLIANSIAVLPERATYNIDDLRKCHSICTDYAYEYNSKI